MPTTQHFILNNSIPTTASEAIQRALPQFYNKPEYRRLFSMADVNVDHIERLAATIRSRFKALVIVGTGASSIIPRIWFAAAGNNLDFAVEYLEDLDGIKLDKVLRAIDPSITAFLVISKSGNTTETVALCSICLTWMKTKLRGGAAAEHFYCMTTTKPQAFAEASAWPGNALLDLARDEAVINLIEHPHDLAGRYAFFSVLGLLPAALAGFDVKRIVELGRSYGIINQAPPQYGGRSSAITEAATYLTAMSEKYPNVVLMTYSNRFQGLALWFRQLMAESLGKAGRGINPLIFEGNVDQHSQLQTYLDGLNDKFFVLLIPTLTKHKTALNGKLQSVSEETNERLAAMNDLQIRSLIKLLESHHKNLRIIEVPEINEQTVVDLAASFIMETVLYSIKVGIDPFSQTGVDRMKTLVKLSSEKEKT